MVRLELSTAAAVDNSASVQPACSIFIYLGKSVQICGATSSGFLEPIRVHRQEDGYPDKAQYQ